MKIRKRRKHSNKLKSILKLNNPFKRIYKEKVEVNEIRRKKKTKSKKERTTKSKPKRSLWKKIITFILCCGIIGVISVTLFFAYIVVSAPKFNEKAFVFAEQSLVYDSKGDIIAKLGMENRENITYDELPQVLIDAIIATEDSRFYQHNGVDLPRFIKASVYQLLGRDEGGASTLTMQLVKNNLTAKQENGQTIIYSSGIKGIIRKFQDVYLAVFKVEKEYSKEEIFELYVNYSQLGSNAWGVEEASKYYFNKSVSELSLPEASIIAGLFQSPFGLNPYKYPERAEKRRNTVLNLMVRHGYITKEEAEIAKSIPIDSLLSNGITSNSIYQGFVDEVVSEVEELTGYNAYRTPMKIYTTMDRTMQDGINSIMNSEKAYWFDDYINSGIAIINNENGEVSALGAGRNRTGERVFNYATDALRQPGSTAKPIFSYGPGFENNNFSTYTLFVDEPWNYTNGPEIGNWDGNFFGLMTLKNALAQSRNIPALKSFQSIGLAKIQQFAYSLGLDVSLNQNSENYRIIKGNVDNTINEAYSIGGVAEGFSPLQMAGAYTAFASMGYYTKPHTVRKIEYRETGEVFENKIEREKVMKDSTAYLINNILEYAVNSGYVPVGGRVNGSHVAGKTGTSNYSQELVDKYNLTNDSANDLWSVIYNSKYTFSVWYGYKEFDPEHYNNNNKNTGFKNMLVTDIMKLIPADMNGWTMPSSVVISQVEMGSWPAKLPSQYTPQDLITTEYFIKGTQPTEISEWYSQLPDVQNVKTSTIGNKAEITWTFTEPNVYSDKYVENYYNRSAGTWGKSLQTYINDRKNKIQAMGAIEFGIYKENDDGELVKIDTTTENEYTYVGSGNETLIIKAEHANYGVNKSKGVEVKIKLDALTDEKIVATLSGATNVSANVGTYDDKGISSVTYGTANVTNKSKISYEIVFEDKTKEQISTLSKLIEEVNLLEAGTYKINYIVTYQTYEVTKTRNVTLR